MTAWSRVLLEGLEVSQMAKNFTEVSLPCSQYTNNELIFCQLNQGTTSKYTSLVFYHVHLVFKETSSLQVSSLKFLKHLSSLLG